MNKNLFDLYFDIFEDKRKWCYYENSQNSINYIKDWNNECAANDFIHSYFATGGKEVFDIPNIRYFGGVDFRNIHTVSVFLLGIIISESINKPLQRDELFTWFLTCLYHDMGYKIEESSELPIKAPTLNGFLKLAEIGGNSDILLILENKTLYENYYKYVIEKRTHIDHGISGGILLYDKLVKNYYAVLKQAKCKSRIIVDQNGDFIFKERYFSPSLFPTYQKAAKAIIEHNMWYATNDEQKETYKQYHLEALIKDDNKRIKLTDNIVFFFLCIADTIEPLKKFNTIEPDNNKILKNIAVKLVKNGIEIEILSHSLEFSSYFNSINSLQDWLDVKVADDVINRKISIVVNY